MGNNQSQSSDEEFEKPQYTYHESVLQEALVEAAKRPIAVDCASDDEQFFSADEGDSVGSITPPRTRPESSSSEDSSDEKDSEEEANVSSNNQNESQLSSSGGGTMRKKKSCGQCNVSRYEEQDSIGPELTRALRRFSGTDSSLRSSSKRNQSKRNTEVDSDILSPFRPIQTPLSISNSSYREYSLSISTEKSSKKSRKELEIPRNASSLSGSRSTYSSHRKRLAYVESSDSEDNEEQKRAKYDSSKRKRHKQEGSDSDSNYSGHQVPEHRNSTEMGQEERKKTRRSHQRSSDSENEHQSSRDNRSSADGTPQSLSAGRGIKRLRIGAFHPPPNYSNARNQTSTTFKMGMQAIRNANGKILPIRNQINAPKDCDQNQERNDVSLECSDLERLDNIAQNIRRRGVNATDRNLKRKTSDSEVQQPPNAKVSQNQNVQSSDHVEDIEVGSQHNVLRNAISKNRDLQVSPETVSDRNSKCKENTSLSPFRGVVLTPPSENNNGDVSDQQKTDNVEIDKMEVSGDESPYHDSINKKERLIIKGKRLGKSAAERFRNFWSEKKIGSNIKSIFATKLKSPSPSHKSSSPLLVGKTSLPSFNLSPLSGGICQSGARNQSQNSMLASTSTSSPSSIFHQLRSSSRNSVNTLSGHHQLPGSGTVTSSSTLRAAHNYQSNQGQLPRNRTPPRQSSQTTSNSVRVRRSPRISGSASQSSSVIYLPQNSQYQVLHFRLADRLSVSVDLGDISEQTTTGIVNWTDGALTHTITDCSKKIAARAGALMRAGCNDYLENKNGQLESPDVLTTPAGGRFSRDVETLLHVTAPRWVEGGEDVNSRALLEVYANCLRFAAEREALTSLSFPLIGLGTFPADMCIQVFFDSLLVYLAESSSSSSSHDLSSVNLVISDAVITDFAEDLLWPCLEHISSDGLETIMSETYNRYFGSNLYEAHQNIVNERSNYSRNSPSSELANEDSSRSMSGRPRVKRPRL